MASLEVFASDELLKTVDELFGANSPLAILNRHTNDAVGAVARQSRLVFSAGPLVRAFSSQTCTYLPELTLPKDELLAHSQSARNMLLGAKNIVEETGPEVKSWPIPGDDLLNSSTKGATRFVSLVSADPNVTTRCPNRAPPTTTVLPRRP
jgi:hypothetical protein